MAFPFDVNYGGPPTDGVPGVVRVGHDDWYKCLIEANMLTFDRPYTRKDGRTGYKATEVVKRSGG